MKTNGKFWTRLRLHRIATRHDDSLTKAMRDEISSVVIGCLKDDYLNMSF